MATVKSLSFRGKTVNVPHLEHREIGVSNAVTFDPQSGEAAVHENVGKALLEFYPNDVELVRGALPEEYVEQVFADPVEDDNPVEADPSPDE
jgi:hypothetical protein